MKGIILSAFGVLSSTGDMLVFSIAPSVENITNARINVRHAPRLVDRNANVFATRGDKTIHATIKVAILEPMLAKKCSNTLVVPIGTATRPLDHDSTTVFDRMSSHILKRFPELSEGANVLRLFQQLQRS